MAKKKKKSKNCAPKDHRFEIIPGTGEKTGTPSWKCMNVPCTVKVRSS